MGRRKGELTTATIDRGWPYQVAVPATDCRGSHGRFMDAFCLDLSVCERQRSVFHEDKWWIVYCFADAEHAEKFRMRFGGERFHPKVSGRDRTRRGGTRTQLSAYIAEMCGRFTRYYTWEQIRALYRLTASAAMPHEANIR